MSRILLFTVIFSCFSIPMSFAQDVCGSPERLGQMNDPERFCNIYDRQFVYREQRLKFREMLDERREDYYAPQREAHKKYQEDLKALNEERSHENDVTAK